MKPRKRLVPEKELPPINFSINKEDVMKDDEEHVDRQQPFFKSFFDAGITDAMQPDLEKRLIVQTKKL